MKVYGVLHVIVRSAMGISPTIHVYAKLKLTHTFKA